MAWTSPRTWVNDEPLTADQLNTHLRDNLNALKSPPSASVLLDEPSDYITTATSFVDIDPARLGLTLTTSGGDLLVGFFGVVVISSYYAFFNLAVDGVAVAGDDGLTAATPNQDSVSFVYLLSGLAAGVHTIRLQWCVSGSSARLYAGAGTASRDLHPQFWAREVS